MSKKVFQNQKYQTCIDACNDCFEACEACATACLREQDVKMMTECIQLCRECTEICASPSGASSFVAEANIKYEINTIGCDPLFDKDPKILEEQGEKDIEYVVER